MGCATSKLGKEDNVRRCKERRRLMKEAVQSRHHLASAHSDYLRSLLSTGYALSRFALGEPLSVSEQTPPILLHSISSSASLPHSAPRPRPPPPATAAAFSPSPSPTIAGSKLPHILSDSSVASTPYDKPPPHPPAVKIHRHTTINSTYSTTPSQASSVWDWENFYPPSPPDSEFFNRIEEEREKEDHLQHQNRYINRYQNQHHHLQEEEDEEDEEEDEDEDGEGREDVHYSELGDQHCSSSTTSSPKSNCAGDDEGDDDDNYSRSERFATQSDFGGSEFISKTGSSMGKTGRGYRSDTVSSSSASWTARDDASASASAGGDLRMVMRHRDLAEIVAALGEYFVKAAGAGEHVSEILEIGRAQLDRSFRQIRSEWRVNGSVRLGLTVA